MIKIMTYEDYFNKAKKSLFRFEALQDYSAMDDNDQIEYFLKSGKLKEYPKGIEWCEELKKKHEQGIYTGRVRLIEKPVNDYTKWEVVWHTFAAETSGDDIRGIEKEDVLKITQETFPDFWLIDDRYVFILKYGPQGKYLGSEMVHEDQVSKYVDFKNKLLASAPKINDIILS